MENHDPAGSPFTPHTVEHTAAMLAAVGADDEEDLFDIPPGVAFTGEFGIPQRSEQAVREEVRRLLDQNDELIEFLGRGHYDHYQPAILDALAGRSEFLTSYTQYQPEIAQGFLQALFEYQSLFVELTGLEVVNCSMYDAASALGEAALLAARARQITGKRVLVPAHLRDDRRSVLENYVSGAGLTVETYAMDDGVVDLAALESLIDENCAMVYLESPTARGVIEERVPEIASLGAEHDALTVMGTDPVALAMLAPPGDQGIDVVIGDAATLGLPASYGTGLGLFAARESYLRQVPGRLVGTSEDANGQRAYTLTLQTREQHIRRERATSNICTNQAWVALRTAMHLAWLGPDGLLALAAECFDTASEVADALDAIDGVRAPVHDRHHFREFVIETDRLSRDVAADLERVGYAVHTIDEHHIQVCVTETAVDEIDGFLDAFREVAA